MSINFHAGIAESPEGQGPKREAAWRDGDPRVGPATTAITLLNNAETITAAITSGVCDRFPSLNFVSVESGFGYVPYLLESLDWHWKGYGAHKTYDLLPSEYFRRQIYGSFWFEMNTLSLLEQYPDNFMFETDFPHPTSLSPGPASPAEIPRDHLQRQFKGLSESVTRKALQDNAARLYHIDTTAQPHTR